MSALQFNLLPDVKLAYITAQRTRNLIIFVALAISGVALAILIITFLTVEVVQKKELSSANTSVSSASKQLNGITGLDQVLTVQNQLSTLATLHQSKHISSRIFTFLPEITPTNVNIGQVSFDFKLNTMTITGGATSQLAVNTFVDTLKFVQYKLSSTDSEHAAFSSVVESSFSINPTGATYSLALTFDPALFSNSQQQTPQIVLHSQVTTRSAIDDPNNVLFTGQGATGTTKPGGQ